MGDASACFYLGLYAKEGFLGEPDFRKAIRYYEDGIDRGDEQCPVNLGKMYCLGEGMPVNLQKGFELYLLGYVRGDSLACANLGYCFEIGQGVDQDMDKALAYYREGAERGEEHCMDALERLEEE